MNLPKYVESASLHILGGTIHPTIPDVGPLIKSMEIRLATWLTKAEEVYERNKVMESDSLVIRMKSGIDLVFHQNHMCIHKGYQKVGHFPIPLGVNSTDAVALYKELEESNEEHL